MSTLEQLLQPLRATVTSAVRLAINARSLALSLSRDVVRDSRPVVKHARNFVVAAREQLAVAAKAAREAVRNTGDRHVDV